MKGFTKEFSAISVEDMRKIRGYRYTVLSRAVKKIPALSGIYIWRYWPSLPSLDRKSMVDVLHDLQNNFPRSYECVNNSRINVTVEKTPFGNINDNRDLFGFSRSSNKEKTMLKILDRDDDTKLAFAHTLEILIALSPPLYIGKAANLQLRLEQHFDYKTNLLNDINKSGIQLKDVYISFIVDEDAKSEEDEDLSVCIEEILQRITNPPLTKRYG